MSYFDKLIDKEVDRINKKIEKLKDKRLEHGCKYDAEIEALEKEKAILKGVIKANHKELIIGKVRSLENDYLIGANAANEIIKFIRSI